MNRLNNMSNRVKDNRTDYDMVYEIVLKVELPLALVISEIDVRGKTAYAVDDFLLLIFLAEDEAPEMVEELCDYTPTKLVIGKQSFDDDATAMSNAHYTCKDREIELKLV